MTVEKTERRQRVAQYAKRQTAQPILITICDILHTEPNNERTAYAVIDCLPLAVVFRRPLFSPSSSLSNCFLRLGPFLT